MPVEIVGVLPPTVDAIVRNVLRQALDSRPQTFVVHISWPHADMIVHVQQPFDRKLKFNCGAETDVARELYTTLTEIVEGELWANDAPNTGTGSLKNGRGRRIATRIKAAWRRDRAG